MSTHSIYIIFNLSLQCFYCHVLFSNFDTCFLYLAYSLTCHQMFVISIRQSSKNYASASLAMLPYIFHIKLIYLACILDIFHYTFSSWANIICTYVYIYIYIYVCMYLCMYVCMYSITVHSYCECYVVICESCYLCILWFT